MAQARRAGPWEALKMEAQSAFNSVGNTYQQILIGGRAYPDQTSINYDIAESSFKLNPEYAQMEKAYVAQETEKEELWKGYEQWRDQQPEYQQDLDLEPER